MTKRRLNHQVLEDNGGGLHLAVFGTDDECIYYASGLEHLPVADVQRCSRLCAMEQIPPMRVGSPIYQKATQPSGCMTS